MTIDYATVTQLWRRNKAAVTRARNRKDWQAVIDACNQAFEDMDAHGYPDNWAHFERERSDALMKLTRESGGWGF